MKTLDIPVFFPEPFYCLLNEKALYKVFHGGRAGAKSYSFATAAVIKVLYRVGGGTALCGRLYQTNIQASVHSLIKEQIYRLKLERYFSINEKKITCVNGTKFIFAGLQNISEIKSIQDIFLCWIEEATKCSQEILDTLLPSIRGKNCETWFSFNPDLLTDPIYKMFVLNHFPSSIVKKINYDENPLFPDNLKMLMEHRKKTDYDGYLNIWEGEPKRLSDAVVFKNKYVIEDFEFNDRNSFLEKRYFFGADWGFGVDPVILLRCFIINNTLYIDKEASGYHVQLDDLPQLFSSIPEAKRWKIEADPTRPETIAFLDRRGFNIEGAPRWSNADKGYIKDGLEYLLSFDKIVIHSTCKLTCANFRDYSYKVDKNTDEILPILKDQDNHAPDALRYALSYYIKKDYSIFDVA